MPEPDAAAFAERFITRAQAEHYRDRYIKGKRQHIDRIERVALRELLASLGGVEVAMDLPSGTGRLSNVLAEIADRVIVADGSEIMLEVAREDLAGMRADYLRTNILAIDLPDQTVDLIFCHRLLNHIHNPWERSKIFGELARVTKRYVVLSYYAPGLLTRWRRFWRLARGTETMEQPASYQQTLQEAQSAGLQLIDRRVLRRPPFTAAFLLFEVKNKSCCIGS